MFFSASKALSFAVLASGAFASPLASSRRDAVIVSSVQVSSSSFSFNNWGGLSSLNSFDNFFGSNNFDGFSNQQIIIVEEQPTCQSSDILFIQQQLSIMQEFAKQLILTQLCEVESQVLLLSQFNSGISQFILDLSHQSSRDIGFDSSIASLIAQLVLSSGSINLHDFGFSGSNIGHNLVVPSGSNWNNDSSPNRINDLRGAIKSASNSTSSD